MKKYSTVSELLNDLETGRKEQVEALRKIILNANPSLKEHIKWNAPSYVFDGEDRITFNLYSKDQVKLLLHMGATRKEDKKGTPILDDKTGLIAWNSDIRGTITFNSLDDISSKRAQLTKVIQQWLTIPN